MSSLYPDAPMVDPATLKTIADHAQRVVMWLERDQAEAAKHGHSPDSLRDQITGWQFIADAMREWDA